MKKVKKFFIGNIKTVVAFILGLVIAGSGVYAAIAIQGSSVGYTDTNNIGATTVQGAIDALFTKANNMVPIDPDTFNTNTAKTVYTSSKGVCIKRNNKLNCFKINNWSEEKNHIKQVFSDGSCLVLSSYAFCDASDFQCYVYSNGDVHCNDQSSGSYCYVYADGSVTCT